MSSRPADFFAACGCCYTFEYENNDSSYGGSWVKCDTPTQRCREHADEQKTAAVQQKKMQVASLKKEIHRLESEIYTIEHGATPEELDEKIRLAEKAVRELKRKRDELPGRTVYDFTMNP